MFNGFWFEFSILFIAAIFGSVAILPYSLRLVKESGKNKSSKMPRWMLLGLSILQNTILFAIVIGLGLVVAHQIGLGAPLIKATIMGKSVNQILPSLFFPAFILGIGGGFALLVMDMIFLPYFPEKLINTARKTTQFENITASFYGGINEEFLTRLFGMSLIAWILARIWHTTAGLPTPYVFWIATILMAVIFAIGHLPAMKGLLGKITPLLMARTLLLNIPIGLICGWLFWHYGIEAAVVAHFSADIIYHAGGTAVLRSRFTEKKD